MGVSNQLLDLRTPRSLTDEDCELIGEMVRIACGIASTEL